VPIGQFYTGYRQTVLAPDELVTGVSIPLPGPGEAFRLYKVSRRKDLDISSFGAAIWLRQTNGVVDDIRIAYGGVAPMVLRMTDPEAVIRGHDPHAGKIRRSRPRRGGAGHAHHRRPRLGGVSPNAGGEYPDQVSGMR